MNTAYQKAKITIELEDGSKAEFVAYMRTRERTYYDDPIPFQHDGKWRGKKLPDPPPWNFEGTTVGEITITLPPRKNLCTANQK